MVMGGLLLSPVGASAQDWRGLRRLDGFSRTYRSGSTRAGQDFRVVADALDPNLVATIENGDWRIRQNGEPHSHPDLYWGKYEVLVWSSR